MAQHCQHIGKFLQLPARGQVPHEQQEGALLKPEASLRDATFQQVAYIVPAVFQHAVNRALFALVDHIAVCIADAGHAGGHAGSVRLAQSALDLVAVKCGGGDCVGGAARVQQIAELALGFFLCVRRQLAVFQGGFQ